MPTLNVGSKLKKESTYLHAVRGLLTGSALAGAAAALFLSVIEWIDINLRTVTPVVSAPERAIIALYFGMNILVGLSTGLVVGLLAAAASAVKSGIEKRLSRTAEPGLLLRIVTALGIAAVAAFLLNQNPYINRYIIGMIREGEKIRWLRNSLLTPGKTSTYLIVLGLIVVCWLIWTTTHRSGSMNPLVLAAWQLFLICVIGFAYYADSRIELQLYEYSFHRSMYMLALLMAAMFIGSFCLSKRGTVLRERASRFRFATAIVIFGFAAFILSLSFTFFHFGKNQNLKTIVFYHTTQAKQSFKLAWWALDFDRDGYASLLDGGDVADRQEVVNPGQLEAIGDGVDNNCIGGELTALNLNQWRVSHRVARDASSAPPARHNIIYVFVDTVRADHLSAYGYSRHTTPNIDRLASRAAVFENAFSPAARTSEALPKFMQSTYWDARVQSWPQVLARNGYNVMLFPGRRSWERYSQWMPVVPAAQGKPLSANIDIAIETLGAMSPNQPFCAYIYIPDPHRPYVRHAEFNYGASRVDLYDGELAYTDSQLGRLFDWMDRTGRFKDTMVVLMSDHGESLGERGVYRHATQLYNEQTHVPMILYVPNQTPRRITDFVSTIDLGSTILSLVGVEVPESYLGVNLAPLIRGEAFIHPPIYGEQTSQEVSAFVPFDQQIHPETKKYMVITQDGYKLIYNRDFYDFELFDLKNDPAEQRNLFNRLPEKAAELRRLLGQFVDAVTASRPPNADEGRYSRAGRIDGDKVEE